MVYPERESFTKTTNEILAALPSCNSWPFIGRECTQRTAVGTLSGGKWESAFWNIVLFIAVRVIWYKCKLGGLLLLLLLWFTILQLFSLCSIFWNTMMEIHSVKFLRLVLIVSPVCLLVIYRSDIFFYILLLVTRWLPVFIFVLIWRIYLCVSRERHFQQ